MATAIFQKITLYLRMIKFEHSVFALPFAFTSAFIAAAGIPDLRQLLWIGAAMVGARSAAMGLNRVIDRHIDRENPRTANREIPRGAIGVSETIVFIVLSFGLMAFAAYQLNPLCFQLSPVAAAVLVLYSYTKRFTWLSHFVLGLAISGGPIGGWIAVTGTFDPRSLLLGFAVIFWLAGFDVLYALQDIEFDRTKGLYSIPRRFGINRSLVLARCLHAAAYLLLLASGYAFGLGLAYWIGMAAVAGLFIYEHSLVRADDLSKLNMAFFNMNGYISLTVFIATFADFLV